MTATEHQGAQQPTEHHCSRPSSALRTCSVGDDCVPGIVIVLLVISAAVLAGAVLYILWAIWPSGGKAGSIGTGTPTTGSTTAGSSQSVTLFIFGQKFKTTTDEQLFAIVAAAGTLGGLVHTLKSLAWYIGNRNLRWSWVAFYLLTPALGALIATVFYIVARAGLFSTSADTNTVSPFGFTALAALVGLFSDQAMIKLKKIAESALSETEPGADHVAGTTAPTVTTRTVSNITATSAEIEGTVNPGGAETTWKFEYGRPPAHDTQSTGATLSGAADHVVRETLGSLTPNTTYQVRLIAANAQGSSEGTDVTFRTTTA
jgi:hypothetical protein